MSDNTLQGKRIAFLFTDVISTWQPITHVTSCAAQNATSRSSVATSSAWSATEMRPGYTVSPGSRKPVAGSWNTTPAWAFPYASSPFWPGMAPVAGPIIDGGFAQSVRWFHGTRTRSWLVCP